MATANVLYGRLDFSFDTSKFGDAINLSDGTKEFLNTQPIVLKDWQISDLANSNVTSSTNYYKNPVLNVSNSLKANVYNLYNTFISIEFYDNANATAQSANIIATTANLLIEIENFKSHTNNVSGVSAATDNIIEDTEIVIEYPDYDKIISLGRDLVMLLNATDNRQDATPVLGSMTSLFVAEDISNNNVLIVPNVISVNNTLRLVASNVWSNITLSMANSIYANVLAANNLIASRREHDWNFYREGLNLMKDYSTITKLEDVGQTQEYLIKNLIGTESYISKITANN
jgi:hypothetical protein